MRIFFACLGVLALLSSSTSAQQPINPRAQQNIAILEPLLAESEQAAGEWEKQLQPHRKLSDANVIAAADSVELQIAAARSVRRIIAEQPDYLAWHVPPQSFSKWKDGAEYFLECAREKRDPFAGTVAGARPVRSKVDGQLLLYHYVLPANYDPQKKYPLRVHLHAGAGFRWLAGWVTGRPNSDSRAASRSGEIEITPVGRQHIGLGEVAILDAIADAKRYFAVDEDRVTIGGASYGGTGGFHFGTLFPDQFAAAHSLTGGANYAVPVGNGRYDAYLLGDNLCNLPFVIWDTPGDGHYKPNHDFAAQLAERAAKHPGYYPHRELTDPKGGHGIIARPLQEEGWSWMTAQVRNRFPKLVIFQTHWLRYDGAYWARIDTVENPAEPSRIEAQVDGSQCRVAIVNADRLHLDLVAPLVKEGEGISVRINDEAGLTVPGGRTAYFAKVSGHWTISKERYPQGLVKKHGLSGPMQDAFMEHPVLMVHGANQDRDAAATTKLQDAIVDRLVGSGDGSGVLRTGFDRKLDKDVSDADLAQRNLILVGTPKQNQLLARIVDRLPVKFLDDGVQIAGKEYRGSDVGVAMIYPNPLNSERYVLLVPEDYRGEKPWDYPDYVVLQPPVSAQARARILAKGTFDSQWQIAK